MENRFQLNKKSIVPILFFLSVVLVGLFNEYLSCLFSVILVFAFFVVTAGEKKLRVSLNLPFITLSVIVLFYGLSTLWAVDSGMAFIGFLKYLPICLFALLIMQSPKSKEIILKLLPYMAAAFAAVSIVLSFIPALKPYFLVSDRIAGFFQYPNTFALFLLIAELLLISKPSLKWYDFLIIVFLIFSILYTGSRTAFVLTVIANIAVILKLGSRKTKVIALSSVAAVILAVLLGSLFFDLGALERFLTISFESSTFLGRFLYFKDALPLILKNPFGLGFMGYYYIQQTIQTGVYSVMYIHNDFFQIALDIGILPLILFVFTIIKSIFSKGAPFVNRIILSVIALHSCFDFNLQFVSMFFLLYLFLEDGKGKEITLNKKLALTAISALSALSLYMGVSLSLSYFGLHEEAHKMYPYNTQNQIELLIDTESEQIADDILYRNEYVNLAHSVKARSFYKKGNFGDLIKRKNRMFSMFPFQYSEYEEYSYMLINGRELYLKMGDEESAEICAKELKATRQKVETIESKLSALGKMIYDQPKNTLPDDINAYIENL